MRSIRFNRAACGAMLLALFATILDVPAAAARPIPSQPRRPRATNLFAAGGLLLDVNRQVCGLANSGQVCVAFAGSPVGGGGFWPKGTPDQYIFQSGIQLAGIVNRSSGFAWQGDTVGAFFVDTRGTQEQGDGLTLIYNSLSAQDVAQWPNGAIIRDTSLFNEVLIGRNSASQGDSWVREWEGNPSFLSGRTHPMGIALDQRSLAWNYPTGNEDILYFLFTFYNVTARASSGAYNNSTIDPALQAEIGAVGDKFQDLNEQKFGIQIPDGGYTIDSLYSAFTMDADVAVFSTNYGTAVLPFNLGIEYAGDFLPEVGWQFPPDVFGAPFAAAPGFVGVKYLRSPESSPGNQVGLTMFSTFVNAATGFPDPVGVRQLFRYLSGRLDTRTVGGADNPCNSNTDPAIARQLKLCFLAQFQSDARFFQASGPFSLPPGQARTIVVAYIHAAPLAAPLAALAGGGIGGDNPPGVPASGDSIFANPSRVRPIERVMGWVSQSDRNGNSIIEQNEVVTAPRSLLNKALVAQAVFDNKFLLPFAPAAPQFFLVPGDNQMTIVWQKSASETTGDPYFQIASKPTVLDKTTNTQVRNPLYDPNFRQFDVEGYRVYRGRTAGQLQLIAQFDYSGTSIIDFTGGFDYGSKCAPELSRAGNPPPPPDQPALRSPPGCPVAFDTAPPFTTFVEHDLTGNVIQIPAGGRVQLASGDIFIVKADTAVSGGTQCAGAKCPDLSNSGVPFAFVDTDVRNSFTYFYAVTAFDLNSFVSGPTSLESPRVTKTSAPRASAPNQVTAQLSSKVVGDDNVELTVPSQPWTIDASTGRFTGPPPPTGIKQLAASFAPMVPQLLPALSLEFKIDSVHGISAEDRPECDPVSNAQGVCGEFFVTFTSGTASQSFSAVVPWPIWEGFGGSDATIGTANLGAFPVAADSEMSARSGLPSGFAAFNAAVAATLSHYIRYSSHEGQQSRRLRAQFSPGGSRWFSGADETVDDPAYSLRAGRLTGVDTIYAPLSHVDIDPNTAGVQNYANTFADGGGNTIRTNMQCAPYAVAMLGRQADIQITWGAGGSVTSVRDVTNHVNVPFRRVPDGSYGFIGDFNGNGKIDWRDFDNVEKVAQSNAHLGFCAGTDPGAGSRALLLQNPVITAVSTAGAPSVAGGTLADLPSTGTGFGLYINGQQFIFQLTGGTPPAAGTVWTLRSYAGTVDASTATRGTTDPQAYTYTPINGSPAIPNLRIVFNVAAATTIAAESDTVLSKVHTVPDPYYVTNSLEFTQNSKVLKFVNLPPRALIRIYSVNGVLVNVIVHDDPGFGGEATWNLRNRNNQFVASGVYFYHVETPSGRTSVGRFTVVNFAP